MRIAACAVLLVACTTNHGSYSRALTAPGVVGVGDFDATTGGPFARFAPDGAAFGNVTYADGACDVFSPLQDLQAPGLSAGTLSFTGTAAPFSLSGTNGSYDNGSLDAAVFAPGATIHVQASGGDVPAFSGSVVGPALLASVMTPATVSRSGGATVRWAPVAGSTIWVGVGGQDASSVTTMLFCSMTDTGSFVISPSLIAQLPANLDPASTQITVQRVASTSIATTTGTVSLIAASGTGGAAMLVP